ncbi:hypothetical protein JMJ35_006476 [Cladonia borealis]|uniref:Uncharacterized protein n=1 Tax=Cladonia borealis TaxID=184061 RepID=A0AA39QZ29_9LECA|nr:hypothetical protein JMJ35_006476 [Cladonia borealis]
MSLNLKTLRFKYSPVEKSLPERRKDTDIVHPLRKTGIFTVLIVTTLVTFLLMASTVNSRTISGGTYNALQRNRASVQIAVQVVSAILGYLQVSVVCCLINYATRLRLDKSSQTLDTVLAWNNLIARSPSWGLRSPYLVPILLFILASQIPAALWAGAITPVPVVTQASSPASIPAPQYQNSSYIREYPSEVFSEGPLLRSTKGVFSYSPGMRLLGSLLASGASATTVDGGVRQHAKLDNTRFTYYGRSYGVGASVGLVDESVAKNSLANGYSFQEFGLRADVGCVYNSSTEFIIGGEVDTNIYPALGYLPNSGELDEYSEYYSNSNGSKIVAIGVSRNKESSQRILSIAAGSGYTFLNATQCTVEFLPTLFNVSVGLVDRSINVSEVATGTDFTERENLTYVLMRQFELISNDQTTLYLSLLGDSFNSSIASYNLSVSALNEAPPTQSSATLIGLANSIRAMIDDLLTAYASAQLLIANDSTPTPATIQVQAFVFGSAVYVYLTFAINTAIILVLMEEAFRTQNWRGLSYFDYMDPRSLIIGSSMGGKAVAEKVKIIAGGDKNSVYKHSLRKVGNIRVILDEHESIVLDPSKW